MRLDAVYYLAQMASHRIPRCQATFRHFICWFLIFAAFAVSDFSNVHGSFLPDPHFLCRHRTLRFRRGYVPQLSPCPHASTHHVKSGSFSSKISFLEEAAQPPSPISSPESKTELLLSLSVGHYGKWMTDEDERGRRKVAASVSRLLRSERPKSISDIAQFLLDETVAPDTVFVVESLEGVPTAGVQVQAFRRGSPLASGSYNVLSEATPVPVPLPTSLLVRPKRGEVSQQSARMMNVVVAAVKGSEGHAAQVEEGKTGKAGVSSEPVAVRIALSARSSCEVEAEDECLSLARRYSNLMSKLPPFSSRDLLEKFGMVVPQLVGQLRGRPSLLRKQGDTSLLNFVQIMPLMACDLNQFRITDPDAVKFVVKRMIQLLALFGAAGLVHQDIKAENFLVSRQGRLYLADFDAVVRENDTIQCNKKLSLLFSPPEVLRCFFNTPEEKIALTQVVDSWSLGMAAWEVLCMSEPFDGMRFSEDDLSNMKVIAALPEGGDDTRALDWNRCRGRPPAPLRKAVECLLDRNAATRCKALDLFKTSPLFAEERPVPPEPSSSD
ncbi:rhoptry kinase family protein ROP20 [Toxoplasma gondii TgCatPRC2]|uniref:Rhoptry kinase family protein ROP20 n=1 Tax=Toxoplasma gondii TgCatPRC2 TaxID=1130821 RepID=A0A151HLW7_TOXGO|nr:rhoptry kinase family protein ROP20 [Toxoplasma gondii TgCatPRC2]